MSFCIFTKIDKVYLLYIVKYCENLSAIPATISVMSANISAILANVSATSVCFSAMSGNVSAAPADILLHLQMFCNYI